MAHAHNLPKSEQKPYFTSYVSAGVTEQSLIMRNAYDAERVDIKLRRDLRQFVPNSELYIGKAYRKPPKIRGNFPTKRTIDYSLPSKRGLSKALNQFKIVQKSVRISSRFDDVMWVIKIFQLHATRGWKAYA